MPSKTAHSRSITLKIADRADFSGIYRAFLILLVLAAALSPQPVILLIMSCGIFACSEYSMRKQVFTGCGKASVLIIYPDRNISLSTNSMSVLTGVLGDRHWLTRRLAVLDVLIEGKTHKLVLLAKQQNAGDYRHLRLWLKHKSAVEGQTGC